MKGTFNPEKDPSSKASTHDSESDSGSVGVLELGGGSLQVTLQVDAAGSFLLKIPLIFKFQEGRSYHVYAHSYLGFGQDYAQNAVMKKYGDVAKPGACPTLRRTMIPAIQKVMNGDGVRQPAKLLVALEVVRTHHQKS